MTARRLAVATCQFEVSADVRQNGRRLRRQLAAAARAGAELAHFSECALSGYCGTHFADWQGYDWAALRQEMLASMESCRQHRLWALIGSSHPLSGGRLPHNCVYVVDAQGRLVDRYDKRCCSVKDLRHYLPGDHPVTFELNGLTCGLSICLEWSFPELFQSYAGAGVDCLFHSCNAAGRQATSAASTIPAVMQAHAANHQLFISLANAANPRQDFASRWIRRSGCTAGQCRANRSGLTVNTIAEEPETDAFHAMVRRFRADVRAELQHRRAAAPADPRSSDRRSL